MGGLIVHRSAFDHCYTFAAGYVGCMKELNINGANIDLVSYAHQQDSGKRLGEKWGEGRGAGQCCQLQANFSGQFGGKIRQLRKGFSPLENFPFLKAFCL